MSHEAHPPPHTTGAAPSPNAQSPLSLRSVLLGAATWGGIILVCIVSGLLVIALLENETISRPIAGLSVVLVFAATIPFGIGVWFAARGLRRESKFLAILGGTINGCGLIMLLGILLVILTD